MLKSIAICTRLIDCDAIKRKLTRLLIVINACSVVSRSSVMNTDHQLFGEDACLTMLYLDLNGEARAAMERRRKDIVSDLHFFLNSTCP